MKTIKLTNQDRQIVLRDDVIHLLGITSQQYYQIQFSTAERYMLERTQDNHVLVTEFLKEPLFWAWWRNQYAMVDEYFAVIHSSGLPGELIGIYESMHLKIQVFPDKILWKQIEESYMNTISNIIKDKTNANGTEVSA